MKKSLSEEATEVLESKLGKAEAKAFVRAVDEVISQITEIKWKTTKDELLSAIREEFINKNVFEERTSAIQQSINSSKLELNARIDGVNAKVDSIKAELDAKIEGVRAELTEKIEGVKKELNARIDGVNVKVDSIKAELDAKIEGVRAELTEKIEGVKKELSAKIDKVKSDLERQIQKTDMKLNFLIVLTIIAITLMNPVVAEIIKSLLKF
jgi:outer membrane murein-binding lipoprotein Lpp